MEDKNLNLIINRYQSKKNTNNQLKLNKSYNGNNIKTLNLNREPNNKRILTLSKNRDLLGDKREYIFKRIFTPDNNDNGLNNDGNNGKNLFKSDSRYNYMKRLNGKKQLKDEFLLFAKARPYRYLTTVEN